MLVASSTVRQATDLLAQLVGVGILAGVLAVLAAFLYRWWVRESIPRGFSLLVGLSGVAVYLNTTQALGQVIGGSSLPTETEVALFNIVGFGIGTAGAALGRRAGDRMGADVVLRGSIDVEKDVGRLVKSVGRVITVELPEDIDDVVGYDPVPEKTKEKLAGKTFLFPRRLTVGELHDRLVSRLASDYAVGHVDVELAGDGTVEYLALGSRAAGIGPTLPPATNAVAIRADPAFAASAGDLVQVWETDPLRRVLTAELRGVAGETVTLAIDAADTPKVDPRTQYRLVTLPVDDRPDREFASLLRAADETFSSVTVEAGSPLHGMPVGGLDLTVVAVKPEDRTPVALPEPSYVLAPGDAVFAVARPEALRRLDGAAKPLDPSLVRSLGEPPTASREAVPPTGHSQPEGATADTATSAGSAPDQSTEASGETGPEGSQDLDDGDDARTTDTDPESEAAETDRDAAAGEEPADPSEPADEESLERAEVAFHSDEGSEPRDGPATDDVPAGEEARGGESKTGEASRGTERGSDLDELDVGDDGGEGEFDLGDDDVDDPAGDARLDE